MRNTIGEILEAVEESLPRTNDMLAKGLRPFTIARALGFVAESLYRARGKEPGYTYETMGIVIRRVERGTDVLLKLGTVWDAS